MKKVAVLIPIYRNFLTENEKISLLQCGKILTNYPRIAVIPEGLEINDFNQFIDISKIIELPAKYFESVSTYNSLMMSSEFYSRFLDFEYILIHQLDSFVFKDELNFWCNQNYDYIGAPWISKIYNKNLVHKCIYSIIKKVKKFFKSIFHKHHSYLLDNKVGNGGFSLRKVQTFYAISNSMKHKIDEYLSKGGNLYNEDVFWSIEVNKVNIQLKIPHKTVGLKFAFEVPPVKSNQLNLETLPFGCHDWDKYYQYWNPIFAKFGYTIDHKE